MLVRGAALRRLAATRSRSNPDAYINNAKLQHLYDHIHRNVTLFLAFHYPIGSWHPRRDVFGGSGISRNTWNSSGYGIRADLARRPLKPLNSDSISGATQPFRDKTRVPRVFEASLLLRTPCYWRKTTLFVGPTSRCINSRCCKSWHSTRRCGLIVRADLSKEKFIAPNGSTLAKK